MPTTTHPPVNGQSRRQFLVTLGAGTAAAVAASSLVSRLSAQTPATADFLQSSDPATDSLFVSATKLAQLIREKKLTAVEAVTAAYQRIDAVNPKINAVVTFCRERAFAEAKEADAALAKGKILGPLHGVPFTIKDSFDTAGVVSTGGTLGRKNFIPGVDATVVARLRAAGGILLGKTNTPEFTLGGGPRGTYNLIFGQTYNPYKEGYSPSGSSGGAGAIVASGGSYFDIGSDYGGSIRGPAHNNGIAGIKPSLGRSPRTGHIVGYGGAFDTFQETGPLARRVEDLYLLLSITCGPDASDAAMCPVPLGDPAQVKLKELRVAYYLTHGTPEASAETQEVVRKCVAYFEALGAKVTADMPPKMTELSAVRRKFEGADGREHIRRLLKKHGTSQASPGLSITGDVLPSADFTRLCEEMDAIKSEQLAWFEQYDLILCPSSNFPAEEVPPEFTRPIDAPWRGGGYNAEYNTTGWPAGVVRAGTSSLGLPIGIHAIAQPWRDDVVLAALSHIESKTGGWQKPPI